MHELIVYPIECEGGETEWGAKYPDFPGVVGGGDTPEEAVKEARENLAVMIDYYKEKGKVGEVNGTSSLIPILETKSDCPLLGLAADSSLTVDKFLTMTREEKEREPFDYTEWQKNLYNNMSLEELCEKANNFWNETHQDARTINV